jgi:hypothetical protein
MTGFAIGLRPIDSLVFRGALRFFDFGPDEPSFVFDKTVSPLRCDSPIFSDGNITNATNVPR